MEIHDVNQYIHWNLPRPQFYIQDLLPKEGVMLLYGSPKVKKSWLAQFMGFNISLGLDFLGFRTEQARVLISNFEISPLAYAGRLRDMAVHFQLQDGFFFETSPMLMYLDDNEKFAQFFAAIRTISPQVLILDCMQAFFGGDENDGEAMARLIEKLSLIKTELHCSLVLVHHTNKSLQVTGSVDRARGHSRLTGWVDTLVYMAEQPNCVQLQIKARQATREVPNTNIYFQDFMWHLR